MGIFHKTKKKKQIVGFPTCRTEDAATLIYRYVIPAGTNAMIYYQQKIHIFFYKETNA